MKLRSNETAVVGSGDIQMKGFSIATSAKAFRILSSNLYKYKVRAIVRELCCNAVDGHVALTINGKEARKTFDVQLPTMLDSQFRVRDYGIGLSHDDIMNMYTTYFASTKAESDEFVGALGLGSKSPFSYTDTFTVTSWFDGVKTIYSAFIKDGEPNIAQVHQEPTTEHTGIEIVVPTGTETDTWNREARRVFCSFGKYRPNFIGRDPQITYLQSVEEGRTFVVNHNLAHGTGLHAIMGGVVYPIPNELWEKSFISLWAGSRAYYIHFDLGELDITPSREELSLDDVTISNIKSRLSGIDKEYEEDLDKMFAEATSVRALYETINAKYPDRVWSSLVNKRVYAGKTISEWKQKYSGYAVNPIRNLWIVRDTSGSIRRSEVKKTRWSYSIFDPHAIINFGKSPKTCIINDLDTKNHNVVLRGAEELGLLRLGNVNNLFFNVNCPNHGKQDQANFDLYASAWEKADGLEVVYLSKIKDQCVAKMKEINAKNPQARAARTGQAHNVVIVTKTGVTESKMYVQDIDELEDVHWCGTYYDDIVHVNSSINVDNKLIIGSNEKIADGVSSIRRWLARSDTVEKVYVFRKMHWLRASKNDTISQIDEEIKSTFEKELNDFKVTDVPIQSSSIPRWVQRLNANDKTRGLYSNLVNITSGSSRYEFLSELNQFTKAYRALTKPHGKFLSDVEDARSKNHDNWNKFKENNLVIYTMLNNVYSLGTDVAEDIMRIVRK